MKHVTDAAVQRVRDAADAIVRDDAIRTINFAEAVHDATPQPEMLAELAVKLEALGCTTPRGDAYTVDALRANRAVAAEWRGQWLPQAAFRTHQEAVGPNTDAGKILAALCAVARGENPPKPKSAELNAWKDACTAVRIATDRGRRFMVSANTLRLAMGRKPNVPGRFGGNEVLDDPVAAAAQAIKANPTVAGRLMKDPAIRSAFSSAYSAHVRSETDRIDQQDRRTAPGLTEASEFNEAGLRLDQAEARIDQAIELLAHVAPGRKNVAEITEIVDRIEQKLVFLRSWAEGNGRFDDALENLLKGGERS